MKKMKKATLLAFLVLFSVQSIAFAAVGGSKTKSATPPPPPKSSSSSTNSTSSSTAPNYKPSTPASTLGEKAPAAKPPTPPASQQSTSGGFLRSLGMFGGGMLMGSMLGNMFGFGNSGAASGIFGLLFNLLLLGGLFMGGRFLWSKYQESKRKKDNPNQWR